MSDFRRRDQSNNRQSFDKPRFNNDRPDMHSATCASCGKTCEVPFRPTGSKPVYCRDCFQNNNQGSEPRRSENRSFGRQNTEERQMYDAVCSECGNSCQIPFRPSNGRDVFCSRCFEKQDGSQTERPERRSFDRPNANRTENRESGHGPAHFKAQFEALNTKLDKILGLLEKSPAKVVPLESEIDEKEIEKIVEEIQEVIPEKKPRKARKVTTKKTDSSKK